MRVGSGRGCGGEVRRACGIALASRRGLLAVWLLLVVVVVVCRVEVLSCEVFSCVARYRRRRRWLVWWRAGFSQALLGGDMMGAGGGEGESWRW